MGGAYDRRARVLVKSDLCGVWDIEKMLRLSSERAQATVEYGLLLALVVVTVIVALITVGGAVKELWTSAVTAWPA